MRLAVEPLVLAATLLVPIGCSERAQKNPDPPQPPNEVWLTPQQVTDARLVITSADEQDVGGAVVTSGKVTFDDLRVSHVFSPVTGRVVQIQAQPGQRVKRGAPLVTLTSPDVGSAFSDLGKAQADLVAAEHEFKRQKDLYEVHAAAQKDYEAAQDNYSKAKAELDRARQKARLFRADSVDTVSQEYTLRALIDGEVIARNVNPGTEVQGQYSGGNAVELFTIGELDRVWVLADVFEMDLAQVKKGARVTLQVVAYPKETFEGHVDWVSDSLDPQTRTAKVRCAIKNPDRELKPEMYATVTIAVAERRALAVPRSALLRLGDQIVTFVETGTTPSGRLRFERRPIAINEDEASTFVPVVNGLARGEKIVSSGAILLSGML